MFHATLHLQSVTHDKRLSLSILRPTLSYLFEKSAAQQWRKLSKVVPKLHQSLRNLKMLDTTGASTRSIFGDDTLKSILDHKTPKRANTQKSAWGNVAVTHHATGKLKLQI